MLKPEPRLLAIHLGPKSLHSIKICLDVCQRKLGILSPKLRGCELRVNFASQPVRFFIREVGVIGLSAGKMLHDDPLLN